MCHDELLPGRLLLDEQRPALTTEDVHAREALNACGATYDFLAKIFLRNSIDNRGVCSTPKKIAPGFQAGGTRGPRLQPA